MSLRRDAGNFVRDDAKNKMLANIVEAIAIITITVYAAVIVAVHCHCERSPGSSDECSMQHQVAADTWTKPISLSQ